MRRMLFTVIPLVLIHCSLCFDPCEQNNYRVITGHEAERRSTAYVRKPGDIDICDRNLPKAWYRVVSEAGGDMPTTFPGAKKCSTSQSLWLKGKLPKRSEDIVIRTVCIPLTIGNHALLNCRKEMKIQVKNCGIFNVYELVPTTGCPYAYCFGSKARCKLGFSSKSGFEPCGKSSYKLYSKPIVSHTLEKKGQHFRQVVFTCNINEPATTNLNFDVVWYISGKKIYEEKEIQQNNMPAKLYEDKYKKFGITVTCMIRGRIATAIPGHYVSAKEPFYAGIKILTPQLLVREGEKPAKLQFKVTVPVACPDLEPNCYFVVEVNVPKENTEKAKCVNGLALNDIAMKHTSCGVTINTSNWKKIHELEVVGTIDGVVDGNSIKTISFGTGDVALHPAWSNYKAPNVVKVEVVDKDSELGKNGKDSICKSVNDPHMTTFDGNRYECHLEGEYILYRHKTMSVEVQMRHKKCLGFGIAGAKCNCGVAVRSGGDIFIVDQCIDSERHGRNGVFKVGMVGCDRGSGLRIEHQNNGKDYLVHLPTGGRVDIKVRVYNSRQWLDVFVYPSVLDIGHTEGLCGTLNGACEDDLVMKDGTLSKINGCANHGSVYPNDFSLSWRVDKDPTESLFQGGRSLTAAHRNIYCKCDGKDSTLTSTVNCNSDEIIQVCAEKNNDITKKHFEKCRRRRDAGPEGHDEVGLDFKDLKVKFDDKTTFVPPKWTNGWTETKAKDFCTKKVLNSKMAKSCEDVIGVQPDVALEQCIADIKLTGQTEFASSAAGSLAAQCLNQLTKNVTAWVADANDPTETVKPPLEKLGEICPSECSYKGICQKGKCICNLGRGGDDCSIDLTIPPSLSEADKLCDTDKRPCKKTPVYGNGFLQSNKITCRVTPKLKIGKRIAKVFKAITSKADFISFAEVFCTLPPVQCPECINGVISFDIQISNDQIKYSKSVQLIRYNSLIWDCSKEGVCQPKEPTLYNNGFCDISKKRCTSTKATGGPFINSPKLTCHLQPIWVHKHEDKDMAVHTWGTKTAVRAQFHNAYSVTCPLPPVCTNGVDGCLKYILRGYEITVTNNDVASEENKLRWLTYDPKYWTCATGVKNGVCTKNITPM